VITVAWVLISGTGGGRNIYFPHDEGRPELLFTENETNDERIFGRPNRTPFVKDAFHAFVVQGRHDAVNPAHDGTKAAALYRLDLPAGGRAVLRLRLSDVAPADVAEPFADFDRILSARTAEADEFYRAITPLSPSPSSGAPSGSSSPTSSGG
jgi:hypothetical protein